MARLSRPPNTLLKTGAICSHPEKDDYTGFNKGSITIRTPLRKYSTPTNVPKAPKKKETTLNISKPLNETEPTTVPETPPSMARNTSEDKATHEQATRKTTQVNNSLPRQGNTEHLPSATQCPMQARQPLRRPSTLPSSVARQSRPLNTPPTKERTNYRPTINSMLILSRR